MEEMKGVIKRNVADEKLGNFVFGGKNLSETVTFFYVPLEQATALNK